jgi:glycosyltransferase involved in cell wall biosynthesis
MSIESGTMNAPAHENCKPSICIISHNAYGMISGGKTGFVGGVEWQTALLARWLADKGYIVAMLTWDEGGPAEEKFGNVRVIKVCKQKSGIRGIRFFHPKWTGLISAMQKADADVYYHNCAEAETGQIGLWCRRNRRRFVFTVAHDSDCSLSLPLLTSFPERLLYRSGLRSAKEIIVQTFTQQKLLRKNFNLNSTVIRMPCPGPIEEPIIPRDSNSSNRVIWIGRVCYQKRPDRLIEIALACPELQFDLIGPVYNDAYSREVVGRAKNIPNITVHGMIPKNDVFAYYQKSACLCSTSDSEGFPNTFLEAWSTGLPIVSLFDPDGLIESRFLGIAASNTEGLISGIKHLYCDPAYFRKASRNARTYYEENHSVDVVMPQFERIFQNSTGKKMGT